MKAHKKEDVIIVLEMNVKEAKLLRDIMQNPLNDKEEWEELHDRLSHVYRREEQLKDHVIIAPESPMVLPLGIWPSRWLIRSMMCALLRHQCNRQVVP